jgi:glutamyl-tRNA reductase
MAVDPSALVAVGLSHHTAPVHVRERMAFGHDEILRELSFLREARLAREAMLLSTCNRVELYVVAEPGSQARLRDHLVNRRTGGESLERYLYWHEGPAAVRHLFRVACSLDSLVVGEPQILGQVKEAVRIAEEAKSLGTVLNRLTQRTLWVAKQVRTNTDIGRHNVGVGNAGVFLAQQIFSTLRGRRALLVGAGEMGRQVAKALLQSGIDELFVASRTMARSVEVAEEFGATPLPYDRFLEYLARVDIVITATAATRPIVAAEDVRQALRARRYASLLLIDLSVPRNISPEVDKLDQAYLFNVDDLTQVVERGKQARVAASGEAERIVEEETRRFADRLASLELNDAIGAVARKAEALRRAELHRSRKLIGSLEPEQVEAVDRMTTALTKKLLHGTLTGVREAMRQGDLAKVEVLLGAFAVDEDEP